MTDESNVKSMFMPENEIRFYELAVEDLASNHKDEFIHNYGNEHAKVICSAIFRYANNRVRLLANNLCNEEVSGTTEYINAMDSFLDKKDTKLEIILTDFSKEKFYKNPEFLYSLYYHPAFQEDGRVIIKYSIKKPLFTMEAENGIKEIHFCVADGVMTRLETDTKDRLATCNFGNKEFAQKYDAMFDSCFNDSEILSNLDIKNLIEFESH